MGRINKIVCAVIVSLISGVVIAQNNTNSPYTRYHLGQLSDQSSSKSKAMGGVAYALRDNSQINPLNPASYTAMDSLTFLFEGGVSFQNANFSDGTTKLNAKNSSFDYLVLQFRLKKWMAMSAGVLPLSNVGYNINELKPNDVPEASAIITRYGSGGLHQFYTGVAFKPIAGLSLGANVSFLWGTIQNNTEMYFPNALLPADKNTAFNKNTTLKSVKLDFGAQYEYALNKNSDITIGAVFSPKMSLSNDIETVSLQNVYVKNEYESTFHLPNSFGFGVAYNWQRKLTVSMDVQHQEWSKVKFDGKENQMLDYTKISFGAEYLPKMFSRNYFSTIKYRLGAYYANPYYKIEGKRAAKEYGVSAGLGFPIPKVNSQLNISAQFIRIDGQKDNFLKENYIRVNVGLIFSERWFAKRKI